MTNLTHTNDQTNLTKEYNPMQDINKSAIISTMASDLFNQGLPPTAALKVAVSFTDAYDYYEGSDTFDIFIDMFLEGLNVVELEAGGKMSTLPLDGEDITDALQDANYLTEDDMGERFDFLCSQRSEAYAPPLARDGVTRRFDYQDRGCAKNAPLFKEAVRALESTEFTVDANMLSIALQVQARMGGIDEDKEGYVLSGCQKMDSDKAYVSEFKGDTRGRLYQASCHGPNGQSSDRSRALMDLVGVPIDYDVDDVKAVIKAEIMDMVSCDVGEIAKLIGLATTDTVNFVIQCLSNQHPVGKPWSFVKAAFIWVDLCNGKTPYIGMSVGLDAKCSGPQLGALMVADQRLAAACGFTMEEVDDAYHLAIEELEKAGFTGISREMIKKPYMGIFYGQGWMAFTGEASDEISSEILAVIHVAGDKEDNAKRFHKAVVKSFGVKMNGVRELIKSYAEVTQGKTKYLMPDGFEVAMDYKVKVNIVGEEMTFDTPTYDVHIRNNFETYKFISYQLKTKQVHTGDFARNGFVNMIQATDAMLARLIIVNLKRLKASHIIAVHDCFRVNVTEMHILKAAIKLAYLDLFGTEKNRASDDMPLGTDIIGMYFEGANKQLVDKEDVRFVSQFTSNGTRYLQKVLGHKIKVLISALAKGAYYFAK